MPKGGLTWVLCNQAPSLPVFSPLPPSSVSSASHDGLDVIFLFFPLKTGEQKLACVLMWANAKCFYNDVMLLLCSPPAPLPLLLHHLDCLTPFGEATHKCKHKQNQVSNKKKTNKWWHVHNHDVHDKDVHKNTHHHWAGIKKAAFYYRKYTLHFTWLTHYCL